MTEKNNDIFLAGSDAVVYLAKPVHKKYSTTFVWGHPFSMYVSYDRFSPCPTLYTIWMNPVPFPQLCTYLIHGLFLNQKVNKNIRVSYSLKYKLSKKIFLKR